MIKLSGAPLATFDISHLTRVADLSYFDGPLISLFQSKTGDNHIFVWVDRSDRIDRWLNCPITNEQLEAYLTSKESLKSLLLHPKPGFLFSVDMKSGWEVCGATVLAPSQIPGDYLPEEESFHEGEAQILNATPRFSIPIDGSWGFEDLYKFPRLLRQSYAFLSHFVPHASQASQLPSFPMRDGFSSMHFFRELANDLPSRFALSFQGMRYASPGSIVFEGQPEITKALFSILLKLKQDTPEGARNTYKFLHSVLSDKKLLGEDAQVVTLKEAVDGQIKNLTLDLLQALDVPNPVRIFEKCANTLAAAKVSLAFFRLLDQRLLDYERQQRIAIPSIFRLHELESHSSTTPGSAI